MQHDFAHLPITSDGRLAGILTKTNLLRAHSRSAVYMIGEIHRYERVADMAHVVRQIPELLVALVEGGASAHKIGRIITSICDALTHRLIALAEARLGEPPVPYVWAACGSQGRQEQTGVSDQDNCLILGDSYDEAAHGAYFKEFATIISDGLNECGYYYCPGEMMATNKEWRQPLRQWQKYFRDWIDNPGPKAQMLASVMFDLRPIHGKRELFDSLQRETLEKARKNSIFIAHLLSNALTHTPPLGFFGTFSLEGGEHRGTINLKLNGVVPVVDIARVYALEAAITEVNTHRRLEEGRSASVLSESGAADLLAAFEFIAMVRLRHQARQIRAGKKPDNYMAPDEISHLERDQLKKAFQVVKTIQAALSNARQIGAR
jgi:CBS domain-containing protein